VKNIRNLVGTPGPCIVLPVSEQQLSLSYEDPLSSPVDVVALSIGNVGTPIGLQLKDPCAANVKVGKVSGRNPVTGQQGTQFIDAGDPTRNNRIRIDGAADASLLRRP
jgi:hypothetical protein